MDMVQLHYMYMHTCKCTMNVKYVHKQKRYTQEFNNPCTNFKLCTVHSAVKLKWRRRSKITRTTCLHFVAISLQKGQRVCEESLMLSLRNW